MVYMSLRLNYIPPIGLRKKVIESIVFGVILSWLAVFIQTLFLGKEISEAKDILRVAHPYFYPTLFLLVVWGPILEEALTRGYFFEILRVKWKDTFALLLSTFLFLLPHGIWGDFGIGLFFIFVYSLIFTAVYVHGGLFASIATHMFVNFYLFYLNT